MCVCVCVCVYIFVLYHVTCQCSVPPHFSVYGTGIVPYHLPVQCAISVPSTWYSLHNCLQSCQINFFSDIWENIFPNSCICVIYLVLQITCTLTVSCERRTIISNLDGHNLNLHEYQTLWDLRSSKCCSWRFLSSGMLCNVYWLTVSKIWLLLMLWSSGSSSPCCSSKAL